MDRSAPRLMDIVPVDSSIELSIDTVEAVCKRGRVYLGREPDLGGFGRLIMRSMAHRRLHDLIVEPVARLNVRVETRRPVVVNCSPIRCTVKAMVYHRNRLSSGNRIVGTETAVRITRDPALLTRDHNRVVRPEAFGNVRKAFLRLRRVDIRNVAKQRHQLGAGNGALGTEGSVRITGNDSRRSQRIDGRGIPLALRNIGEHCRSLRVIPQQEKTGCQLPARHRFPGAK